MDKPTSLISKLPRLIVGLWLTALVAAPVLAQEDAPGASGGAFVPEVPASYSGAGSFFNRQLGTAFRFNYHTEGYGTTEGVVSLGSMKVFNLDASTFFLDAQATLSDEFGGGFNAGMGYRTLSDIGFGFDPLRIHGINFWTDGQSTEADNFFTQLGVGLESLGDSFDLRFQGYFPLDRTKDSERVTVPGADVQFQGYNLLGALQQFTRDTALTVVDLEGAKRIANFEAWAFLGGYHLTGSDLDATGYRAGVRGYAVPDLALSVQVTDDDIYHTNVMFGMTWFVGRTHRLNAPCGTLLDRFREPVLRNDFIAVTSEVVNDPITPLTDAVSGETFVFIHVDSNAAGGGDGTFENPYQTLDEAEAGSAEDNIVFVHSNSTLAPTTTFVAQDGQRILGEGLDPNGNFVDHTVNSAEQGIVSLPETAPGSQMLARPSIDASGIPLGAPNNGILFNLADNNEVNNFTITGGQTAVNADTVVGPQLANLTISDTTGTGIVFNGVTGNSLIENSVALTDIGDDPNDRGILITGGSGVLGANAHITNATGRVIEISGRAAGSVTVGELDQTAGGRGIFVHDNSGGTIAFSAPADVTTTGTESAVELTDNTGTTISFQDLRASSDTATTFAVSGGGTISVADPNDMAEIENTGTGAALVVRGDVNFDGNPAVTVLANVVNTGGGQAVDIQEMTGGSVSVTGDVTDNDQLGMGILVQGNTAGNYSFAGINTLSTGANSAVVARNNTGATITLSNLDATAAAGNTFVVEGGGTVTVNDPNDSPGITNNGTGSALVVRGDDSFDGNPTVTIASNITNSDGGRAVDIQDMTGGGVTITGDVLDTASQGILVQNNSAGTYAFSGNTTVASSGADDAVVLQNNSGATINFTNLNASAVNGNTLEIIGGGNITVSDPNNTGMIENTGGGTALLVRGDGDGTAEGDPNVTINKNIVNSGGGQAVDIEDMTGGRVTINGDVTDTDLSGLGIRMVDNSAGTFLYNGTTTLSTGGNTAVFLQDNDGATITFRRLMATASTADTFVVNGGGTINVNDPNNSATIVNNNTGRAVVVRGDTSFDGNPTLNIAADVTNTTGGLSVDVQDLTGGSVTFSGLVDDQDGGVLVQNNTGGSVIFTNTLTVDTANNDAVALVNNAGATLSFNGLDLNAEGAGNRGFTASGGGTLTVSNVNDTVVVSEVGSAVFLDTMSIDTGNVVFDRVTQTAGTEEGVVLRDLAGPGSVTIGADPNTPGTITSSGGGVLVEGGANNITINTNVVTTGGDSVEIIDRTGGTVAFNGTVNDTGAGMNIANNTGGTINITDDLTFNTAANDAITITDNNGAAINFTNTSSIDLMGTSGSGVHLSGTNTDVEVDADITGGAAGGASVEIEGTATAVFDGDITNTAGRTVLVNNQAGGTATFNGDINDTGQGIRIENNTGGSVSFTGDVTLNTAANDALSTSGNTAAHTTTFTAASQLDIDTTSGDGIDLNGPGAFNVLGTGNTIDTVTGVGIRTDNAGVATINNTTVNTTGAANAVDITHTAAATSTVIFDNLMITTAGNRGISVLANSAQKNTLTITDSTITNVGQEGIFYDTGAAATRTDFTFTNGTITAGNNEAFQAILDDTTGADVRFLIDNSDFNNNSVATATMDILVDDFATLSATIGEPLGSEDPPPNFLLGNDFNNSAVGGESFHAEVVSATAVINLDLRSNRALGATPSFELDQTAGIFRLVDRDDTINGLNNQGTVNFTGVIVDTNPPVLQPTP